MQDITYQGSKIYKISLWTLIIAGNIFFLFGFILLILDLLSERSLTILTNLLFVVLFAIFWNSMALFNMLNSPDSLVLTDGVLIVNWSRKRKRSYQWPDVKLATIGLNPTPMIRIKDAKWQLFKHYIPRIVMIDGGSKRYKGLLLEIEKRKQLN